MEILNIVIPAIVGAVTGLMAAYFKSLVDYRHEISADLLEKRFGAYTEVWKLTEILPKWPKSSNVTKQTLDQFSLNLQKWYFNTGGFLLSGKSSEAYRKLQDTLESNTNTQKETEKITDEQYEIIRSACSNFRTQLTEDLLSRQRRKL